MLTMDSPVIKENCSTILNWLIAVLLYIIILYQLNVRLLASNEGVNNNSSQNNPPIQVLMKKSSS